MKAKGAQGMPIQGAAHGRQCCQNRHPANLPPTVQGATGTNCSLCEAHYETDEINIQLKLGRIYAFRNLQQHRSGL